MVDHITGKLHKRSLAAYHGREVLDQSLLNTQHTLDVLHEPDAHRAFRLRAARAILKSGVPMSKLFDEPGGATDLGALVEEGCWSTGGRRALMKTPYGNAWQERPSRRHSMVPG